MLSMTCAVSNRRLASKVPGSLTFSASHRSIRDWSASNVNDPSLDFSVTGGLDVTLSETISMSLTGSVGGLGRKNYLEVSGGGQVTVQF